MNVFIDTNILLDIYHLSGPDLAELTKLVTLVKDGKIHLLLSQQVIDEYWRNRESVIADAMKKFRESKAQSQMPNIIRAYPEAADLKAAVDQVNMIVKELTAKATKDIETNALKADGILQDLFASASVGSISESLLAKARLRMELGNPPGKKGSIGDAVNWEWLLEQPLSPGDTELVIVSQDGDFESELTKGKIREFLAREWEKQHPGWPLSLEKSLPEFLKRDFPAIKLVDAAQKLAAIEKLEKSWSFAATHIALSELGEYGDFSDSEAGRILKAYLNNNQIRWILTDPDVDAFANLIVGFAKTPETKQLVIELLAVLKEQHDKESDQGV
jgi:hypothetical protein